MPKISCMTPEDAPDVLVRQLRTARALSQEAFARLIGVSVRTMARWESGLSQPSALALEKLDGLGRSGDRSQ